MKLGVIPVISFILSLVFIFVGALLKLEHWPYANTVLPLGILFLFVFKVDVLLEIWSSTKINHSEKWLWTAGVLMLSLIVGSKYLAKGRRQIVNQS